MRFAELTATPKGLVTMCMTAGFAAVAITPLAALLALKLPTRHGLAFALASLIIFLSPTVLFGIVCWWGTRRIHRGVVNDVWTREQLTEGYLVQRSQPFMAAFLLMAACFLIYAVVYFVEPKTHHFPNFGMLAFCVQLPSWVSRSVVADLKPPKPPPSDPGDWSKRPRIFSSSWGQPPQHS